MDPNLAYNMFENKIVEILDRMAPFKVTQVRKNYNVWLTDETKELMAVRDIARDKASQTKLAEDWNEYKMLRNNCNTRQKKDKKDNNNKNL